MYKMWRCLCLFLLVILALVSNGSSELSEDPGNGNTTIITTTTIAATTTAPITTTASETTAETTSTPKAVTTTAVETTTPPATTVTTVAPTQSPKPPNVPDPETGKWNVTSENVTCLTISMAVQFTVNSTKYNLPPNATTNEKASRCENSTALLSLDFGKSVFTLTFSLGKENYLQNIKVFLADPGVGAEANVSLFKTENGYDEYICKSSDTSKLNNITIVSFENIDLIYNNTGTTKSYTCDQDRTSDAVPIAVGCALAGLVIIVLIAYLVGRRRSRQRGYQSV